MSGRAHPVVIVGNPVLHTPTAQVTEFDDALATLIEDLFASMYAAEGVGLAAPQIGVGQAVFVYDCHDHEGVQHRGHVVNPRIIATAGLSLFPTVVGAGGPRAALLGRQGFGQQPQSVGSVCEVGGCLGRHRTYVGLGRGDG